MKSSEPAKGLKKIEECYLDYMTVQFQIQHLQGEVLTILESAMPDGKQQNAVRMLINKQIGRTLTRASELAEPVDEKKNVLPSEALFGFVGWLTTREKPVTMSTKHDAGEPATLVNDYIERQGFQNPRDHVYPKNLK